MKTIKSILLLFSLLLVSLFIGIEDVKAESVELVEFKTELKEVFPEYSNYISLLDNTDEIYRINIINNIEENPKVIFFETRQYDDETDYSLVLFDNGTYASVQSWTGNAYWSGGTTQSGSGYSNTLNRRLTVHYSLARAPMVINNISYSIVSGGYDRFLAHGIAQLDASRFGPQQIKTAENSSGPAYVKFSGVTDNPFTGLPITMLVEVRVGSDSVKVFLQNSQIW